MKCVQTDTTCEEAGSGQVRFIGEVMRMHKGSRVMASLFQLTTSSNCLVSITECRDKNYEFATVTHGITSYQISWKSVQPFSFYMRTGGKHGWSGWVWYGKERWGWVRSVVHMRRRSCVMAASFFHLTTFSIRPVGITRCWKLNFKSLE
jgi:hypothetical protein